MNLTGVGIKPTEGKVALQFVDDGDDEDAEAASAPSPTSEPMEYEGCLAIVIAVGDGVKGIKKGSTVVTQPWARDSICIGDGIRICDAYAVVATLTE